VLVHQEYHNGYVWEPADPDSSTHPDIEILAEGYQARAESNSIRKQLDDAKHKLFQHKEMIEAAELLTPCTP
jgi:hypothetical protein